MIQLLFTAFVSLVSAQESCLELFSQNTDNALIIHYSKDGGSWALPNPNFSPPMEPTNRKYNGLLGRFDVSTKYVSGDLSISVYGNSSTLPIEVFLSSIAREFAVPFNVEFSVQSAGSRYHKITFYNLNPLDAGRLHNSLLALRFDALNENMNISQFTRKNLPSDLTPTLRDTLFKDWSNSRYSEAFYKLRERLTSLQPLERLLFRPALLVEPLSLLKTFKEDSAYTLLRHLGLQDSAIEGLLLDRQRIFIELLQAIDQKQDYTLPENLVTSTDPVPTSPGWEIQSPAEGVDIKLIHHLLKQSTTNNFLFRRESPEAGEPLGINLKGISQRSLEEILQIEEDRIETETD